MSAGDFDSDEFKASQMQMLGAHSELLEERSFLIYHPNAIEFEEHKTEDSGSVITVSQIIAPSNIEFSTKFRSSVDVSRLITRGDMVCKIGENIYIAPNTPFADFQCILDEEFKKAKNQPVSITVLKSTFKKQGKLKHAATVRNALKWKAEQEARYRDPRNVLKRRLDSIYVQLFIFTLIIVDLTIFAVGEDSSWSDSVFLITFVILAIYVIEILLRIYAMRPEIFFKDPLEVLDLIVVITSLILNLVEHWEVAVFIRAARSLRAFRVLRIFRSFRLCVRTTKTLRNAPKSIRQVVRLNKQGYHDDEFDLDLCYITQHIIAMSLPSTGLEKYYRNPINDVVKFMDTHHPQHYMVFDLCLERSYDHSLFHNRVTHYKFQDHGVPTITNMMKLCNGISEWLDRHNENVVAVHCKGGKGRTGTMICAWLLYRYSDATPDEAIELFATMRTNHLKSDTYQGIETYSQRRYVEYFHQFIQNPNYLRTPPFKCIRIRQITIGPLYNRKKKSNKTNNNNSSKGAFLEEAAGGGGDEEEADELMQTEWVARIVQRDEGAADVPDKIYPFPGTGDIDMETNSITFTAINDEEKMAEQEEEEEERRQAGMSRLCGNLCVLIIKQAHPEPVIFASFWIHTYFMQFAQRAHKQQELIIPKLQCDKLHKDVKHVKAPPDMSVKLSFDTYLLQHHAS